jgi:hypothetical protein
MGKFLIGAAVAAISFAAPASAATQIFFSDFENETGNNFRVVNSTGVWTKEAGASGIELQFGNTGGSPASNGGRVKVELDSTSNSGMFYTFDQSGVFALDFLYSPRPDVGPLSNLVELFLDGQFLGGYNGGPNGTTIWTSQSVGFTALQGQKLIFRAGGASDSLGGYVDNIRLSKVGAIPEPGTWMLMILGLGAVGFAMRRRQRSITNLAFS